MKKLVIIVLAILLIASFVFAAEVNNSVILQRINEMQEDIDAIKSDVAATKTSSNLILDILGTIFSRTVRLFSGWDLSSSPYPSDVSIEQGLSSIDGCYKSVFSYQDGSWKSYDPKKPINTLDKLSPDYGYWIKINCSEIDWQIVTLTEDCSNGFDDDLDDDIDCDDNDCEGEPVCDKYSIGVSCTENTNCLSGFCVDDVCCNSACSGNCEECFTGTCTLPPSIGDSCGIGACAGGIVVCSQDGTTTACSTDDLSSDEVCDGADNDCNGVIDENPLSLCTPGYECQTGSCSDIDECLTAPCGPNAICTDLLGTFDCTCNLDYIYESSSCIHQKEVPCYDNAPPNAESVIEMVTIYYWDATGWEEPSECIWECDTRYSWDGTACVSCSDGIMNGDEEGIDCGGSCPQC